MQKAKPAIAREDVNVPELGGEVTVTGLLLRDRLALAVAEGPPFAHVCTMLSKTVSVTDPTGAPWTPEDWEIWASEHSEAAMKLFDVCKRVSGMGADTEKKD